MVSRARMVAGVMAATFLSAAVVAAQGAPAGAAAAKAGQAKAAQTAKAGAASAKLPAAVETAFKKAYPEAQIKHVSRETENGRVQYEIETLDHGLTVDVNYMPDGTLLVEEREVAAADVPAAVTSAITTRYPKAVVTRQERVTEGAKTFYEIGLKGASAKEVQLTPDGAWISPKPVK
jgi:hypothetical protein